MRAQRQGYALALARAWSGVQAGALGLGLMLAPGGAWAQDLAPGVGSVAVGPMTAGPMTAGPMTVGPMTAGPTAAGPWAALVLGDGGGAALRAYADAFHVDARLRDLGLGQVAMLRDAPPEAQAATLQGLLRPGGRLVLYASGPAIGPVLAPLIARAQQAGLAELVVLAEDCPSGDGRPTGLAGLPLGADAAAAAGPGLALLASAGPTATACPAEGARLTDRLLTNRLLAADGANDAPGLAPGLWLGADGADWRGLLAAGAPAQASGVARAPEVIISDVITLRPVSAVQRAGPALAPILSQETGPSPMPAQGARLPNFSGADSAGPGNLGSTALEAQLIFAAQPALRQVALPRAPGMPEPAVIIGLIPEPEAPPEAAPETPPETPPEAAAPERFAHDDLASRARLRAEDPGRFAQIVADGAFDPPEAQLAAALQGELARMGCYRAGIDGRWGNGSRRAVEAYFAEHPGQNAVALDPVMALFRQIVTLGDVTCPAPVVTPVAATPRPSAANSPAGNQGSRPAAAAAPSPAPPAASSPPRIQPGTAMGVFR